MLRRLLAACLLSSLVAAHGRAMDLVRAETQTDAAVAKYAVTGKGVVVAILDRGIDWAHPDFIKPDGTTRIRWLLDMSNAGPNPCDPGAPAPIEFTEAEINAALDGGPAIDSRDAVGHGTVTTGLAAGNGSAFAGGKYRGMAPEADLIIVKLTSEGAPAHDDQPAEPFFQGCPHTALDWLDQKLTQLGAPCVALINSGVQWGPIDGTSAVSRKIDQVFGLNRPGRVYVEASGDEGGYDTHAGGSYSNVAAATVAIDKSSTNGSVVSIWYTGSLPASVSVTFADGTSVGPVAPNDWVSDAASGIFIQQFAPGTEFYPWTSTSADRAVYIYIPGHDTTGSIILEGLNAGTGYFDMYCADGITTFTDHLVEGRIQDYAATLSAISVGCHVSRDSYTALDGFVYTVTSEGSQGELWAHSSGGPTRDGRRGVALTAPGQNAFAAYGQDSWWATFITNRIQDGGGWYGRAGATSGSAPIVVGAVALMLQLSPNLTAVQARSILESTATSDDFTGPTPNNNWGYGKLNVLAAMDAVHALCPPDFNFDGRVDVADFTHFEACATGASVPQPAPLCEDADLDTDNDVDMDDFGLFQRCFSGSAPDRPGCMEL